MPIDLEHARMVSLLVKSPEKIKDSLSLVKVDLVHAILGIAGEAGELVDAVKKNAIYNLKLDRDNLIEELGDLEFYMEQLRQAIGVSREQTLKANMDKLAIRYENYQYSDQQANDRADKD